MIMFQRIYRCKFCILEGFKVNHITQYNSTIQPYWHIQYTYMYTSLNSHQIFQKCNPIVSYGRENDNDNVIMCNVIDFQFPCGRTNELAVGRGREGVWLA